MDVSIIIPTYNRKEKLKACLESIFRQDYPKEDYEVIVVDDGSIDATEEMMRQLSIGRPNLRYCLQSHKGPAAARNLGVKQAKAEIIAFTDNDCILNPDWLKKMVEAHRIDDSLAAVGGRTEINIHNIKAAVSQFLSDGAIRTDINGNLEIIFFPTCNVSFKKRYLNDTEFNELFPLSAGEDLEFFWRLFKKNRKFAFRQDIRLFHNCHSNFKSFLKQAYMYGRGNYLAKYMHKDHPLLKEIKTGSGFSFVFGLFLNFIKIPRFSYLLGRGLIRSEHCFSIYEKFKIYAYFSLHKIMYLFGNIIERVRISRISLSALGEQKKPLVPSEIQSKPEFIILDVTHRCNLKCNICEIRKDTSLEEFSTDEIKGLILQSIEWGVKEFVLSGGEPLLRGDIFEILDFVRAKKYHIGILSNGVLLDKALINKLLPHLIAKNLSLSISLDALTPRIHDDIRGTAGSFEKTCNALRILSELKQEYPDINFNVISIILNENLEELLPLAEFLKTLNVNSIQFQPLLANNMILKERSSRVKYWIDEDRVEVLDKTVDRLIIFRRDNPKLVLNSENNLRLVKKYFRGALTQDDVKCLYAVKTMLIANTGDATTCFGAYSNAKKNKLKQIWDSKAIERARESVRHCKKPCLLPCFTEPVESNWEFKITRLQVESTINCNLRCSICWHTLGNVRDKGEFYFKDFKMIVDQFEHLEGINLQGLGEPFLAKDIFLMIEYARKKGIDVWLASNGTLLNEAYCEKIVRSGLSLIRLSIDARQPEIYNKIRVGADINRVIQNIKNLNKFKKEFNSETPRLAINTVVLKSNIGELTGLVELAKELEASELSLIPLVVFDKGLSTKDESMSSNKVFFTEKILEAKKLAEINNISFESGISMERHPDTKDLPQFVIPQCVNGCYINYKGELSPCCNISYSLGSIVRSSFKELWEGRKYADFRKYILNNKPTCLKCNLDIDHRKILD